jgi:thiamine biosynthesis lipoprotein
MTSPEAMAQSHAGPPTRIVRFRAMNTDVTLQLVNPGPEAARVLGAAEEVFRKVERACTRFDPDSALMRANAAGDAWYPVPTECYLAVSEAARAHQETAGLFDPRVLTSLVALGYDRTLPFESGPVRLTPGRGPADLPVLDAPAPPTRALTGATGATWTPGLDRAGSAVRIGPCPIDLGGIGKGLAVRWAAQELAGHGAGHLVEAGGDCALAGIGPDGDDWTVGVENPEGGDDPVAVLQLTDSGCATSSLRKRAWHLDGRPVHHLVDPRTGWSAAGGLRSVTVVHTDPAQAEVWSKSLLIAGTDEVAHLAAQRDLAVLWVGEDGRLGASPAIRPRLIWTARDVD